MELIATNNSADQTLEMENCLHTYFQVGDIGAVSITGLQGASYVDNAGDGHGALKSDGEPVLRITRETNRLYQDNAGPVEIRDENLKRTIHVEKSNSDSTVVWNPWTTQKLPDDFDQAEHKHMVCVEAGNIKRNKISLAPGKTSALKVVLSSTPFKMISVFEQQSAGAGIDLISQVEQIFSPSGILSRASNFEFRPQQQEMAVAVARALQNQEHLAVEAGTGVGKSLAYLVPAILFAVEQKKKAVVSTHTINLQEQLTEKDLPMLAAVLARCRSR